MEVANIENEKRYSNMNIIAVSKPLFGIELCYLKKKKLLSGLGLFIYFRLLHVLKIK